MAYGQNIEGRNGPGPLLVLWLLRDATTCTMFTTSMISRFLQQKPHALVEELLFATTDFGFVCPAFDPVFVSDKHFIVVQ